MLTHPEDIPKVVAAGREYNLVRLDPLSLARQRHVHKVPVELEVAERGDDVRLVVVPLQAKVLRGGHDDDGG
jgi:hypothetical protein